MAIINKEYYEEYWKNWGELKSQGPASRHVRRIIFSILSKIRFSSIFDVGCGTGTFLQEISKKYPSVKIHGSDFADESVDIAQKNNPGGHFLQLDIAQASPSQKYELVTCIDVLEHIQDDVKALQNMHVMTGKYFLLIVPTGPLFHQEAQNVGHVHGFSKTEINRKLEQVGFKIIKKIAWGFPLYIIYRRVIMNFPQQKLRKETGFLKRLFSSILYFLLFFNLPVWGDRYFVLCENL